MAKDSFMRRTSTWTAPSGPCRRIRRRLRRQESRELPGRLVDWANDHGARLMLLAGDLFDSDQLYSQTAQMLAQALSRFRGTVVIAPGNHDWLRPPPVPTASPSGRTMFTFFWAGA